MRVYIKDLEVPKSCLNCKWLESWMHSNTLTSMNKIYIEPRYFCHILRKNIDLKKSSKADACPLVELPPHGRLIDADALMGVIQDYIEEYSDLDEDGMHNLKWCAMKETEMAINAAPTIVEADNNTQNMRDESEGKDA